MQGTNRSPQNQIAHPPAEIVAEYVIHTCSPGIRAAVEEHCIGCHDCLFKLVVLLHLITFAPDAAERRILNNLAPIGVEAAAKARKIILSGE